MLRMRGVTVYIMQLRYDSRIVGTEGVDKCFIIMRCSADVIRLSGGIAQGLYLY